MKLNSQHILLDTTPSAVLKVTASRCCACGKRLHDAVSVNNGIGPICADKYTSKTQEPCQALIDLAIQEMAMAVVSGSITDFVATQLFQFKNQPRKLCNLLIYWISSIQHDREKVLDCAGIIRTLGYNDLATKLETDRSSVYVLYSSNLQQEAVLTAKFRYDVTHNQDMYQALKKIKGFSKTSEKEIEVPMDEQKHLEAVLMFYMPWKQAAVHAGILGAKKHQVIKIVKGTYADIQSFLPQKTTSQVTTQASGNQTTPGFDIQFFRGTMYSVKTPYNAQFVSDLKNAVNWKDRQWDPAMKAWLVRAPFLTTVKGLVHQHYGVTIP